MLTKIRKQFSRITGKEEPFFSDILTPGPREALEQKLPKWDIRQEGNQCLVMKEFATKEGDALVVADPIKAVIFRDRRGHFLDADLFAGCFLRDQEPRIEPIVAYHPEYDCFTWISTMFSPECLYQITDAITILKGGRGFAE
jgi:hypothetical protein